MYVLTAKCVDEALYRGANLLAKCGIMEESRAGPVIVAAAPVTTVYRHPTHRVLINPVRDANPFFHLFEALWMLAGQDDGRWLDQFVRDFSERFAELDGRIHGAYGQRWRRHFEVEGGGEGNYVPDQLETAVSLLKSDPRSRQVVIAIWDPVADLGRPGLRDRPCNTHIYLRIRGPFLDMTVCCRSNDIVWGAYGANAVHFSVLQEYLAARIGVSVGTYYQISNNYHGYTATLDPKLTEKYVNPYFDLGITATPIVSAPEFFDTELQRWYREPGVEGGKAYRNTFFSNVATPMYLAHKAWKGGGAVTALTQLARLVPYSDWRVAAEQWCARRMAKMR